MNREIKKQNLTFWRLRSLEVGYLFYKVIKDFISQFEGLQDGYILYMNKFVLKNRELL